MAGRRVGVVPAPHAILQALLNEQETFRSALVQTSLATACGFAIAALAGLSIFAWKVPATRNFVDDVSRTPTPA